MLSLELFPSIQPDRGKEAIRRDLMNDVALIKAVGTSVVLLAAVVYLLTDSVAAFLAMAAVGVVALHVMAFRWAAAHLQPQRRTMTGSVRAGARRKATGGMADQAPFKPAHT